ncbi:MAG: DUF91 domain-containing protein [Candidatus Coatesbacteria bacterium]|nr:DUF91 domain-containing protein [Candidatus Coatesbacteria bacterium]
MDEEKRMFPLKEAYRFGAEKGIERELAEIRDMEIEWDLSYTSSLRRGYVVDLFTRKQLFDVFKEQYWPAGKSSWGQRKSEFWLRLKARYEDFLAGRESVSSEDEADEDQGFAAEADLRDFLANNLERVEAGLQLHRDGEKPGVEFPVEDGRIDILASDKTGRFVVFELKLARGRNRALGQLLYYMGWVDKHLGKGPCRGIIVAKEISDDLVLATQRVQGVSLYRYKLSVSVERVSSSGG